MELRQTIIARWYYGLMRGSVIKWLGGRVSSDQMTCLGLLLAAGVPFGFALTPLAGFLLLALSGVADSLDGQLAKLQGGDGRFGAFLDSTVDRLSDGFYLTGFWVLCLPRAESLVWPSLAVFAALVLTTLISYTKARIEGLGGSCAVGFMDRAVRTIALLIWALVLIVLPEQTMPVFWIGISLYLILVGYTVFQRIRAAWLIFA
jgi:CDP-diacylglycerol--glycerol-3-phosphate 3-phosphatidyltransferase